MNKSIPNGESSFTEGSAERVSPKSPRHTLTNEVIKREFTELTGTELKRATKGLYKFFIDLPEDTNTEAFKRTASIYKFFREATLERPQKDNFENNLMLAERSFEAALTGKVNLWRFVCMPELSMETNKNGDFERWNYRLGRFRYDTLTPPLRFDKKLITDLRLLGLKPSLTFVLDDWEAPYVRTIDASKQGYSSFKALSENEQLRALDGLFGMRKATLAWIEDKTVELGLTTDIIKPNILFLSELIDYKEFTELLEALELELDENYLNILNLEMAFVRKSTPGVTDQECRIKAIRRVTQYAVEGAVLAPSMQKSIYLSSEFPVNLVWKKLTLLQNLPTLFYVQDIDVKNI